MPLTNIILNAERKGLWNMLEKRKYFRKIFLLQKNLIEHKYSLLKNKLFLVLLLNWTSWHNCIKGWLDYSDIGYKHKTIYHFKKFVNHNIEVYTQIILYF